MQTTLTNGTTSPAPMTSKPPVQAKLLRREGPATLSRVRDLNVLCVEGDFREMGRQHGALLRDEIARGPIVYYRGFLEKLLGAGRKTSLGPLAVTLLQKTIGGRVAKAMPAFAVDTIRGLSEGSGIPYETFLEGCTMPDSLLWVASRMMQAKAPGPAVIHRMSLGLGCTSAIAWGKATADGKLYHARNFDYHGVEAWPSTQTVIFHKPAQGMRYVSIAAAGVGLGGATAMNEAGLSLTVHQHMFTQKSRLGGTPIGTMGDVVMREARTLADAERILAAQRPIGCWTYLVTSGHEKGVLAWEENPDRQAPRRTTPDDTTFGYANIYLDPELGRTEEDLYPSYWRHNHGRHTRANELLRAGAAQGHDARSMAAILADEGPSSCRVRTAIAFVLTVGSTVFRPEDGVFWVGSGVAPTSQGTWVPFELGRAAHAPEHGELDVANHDDPAAVAAYEHYRRAYIGYVDDCDTKKALRHVAQAAELAPRQPLYHLTLGLLALQAGDARTAIRAFEAALALGHEDEERRSSMHLWHARALDVDGRRDAAVGAYRSALGLRADDGVRAAAKRGMRRAYRQEKASRYSVDIALADVVAP